MWWSQPPTHCSQTPVAGYTIVATPTTHTHHPSDSKSLMGNMSLCYDVQNQIMSFPYYEIKPDCGRGLILTWIRYTFALLFAGTKWEVNTTNLEKNLDSLPPATNISVRVKAFNNVGFSPSNKPVFCVTEDDSTFSLLSFFRQILMRRYHVENAHNTIMTSSEYTILQCVCSLGHANNHLIYVIFKTFYGNYYGNYNYLSRNIRNKTSVATRL